MENLTLSIVKLALTVLAFYLLMRYKGRLVARLTPRQAIWAKRLLTVATLCS